LHQASVMRDGPAARQDARIALRAKSNTVIKRRRSDDAVLGIISGNRLAARALSARPDQN
jgi:hypothetical protein